MEAFLSYQLNWSNFLFTGLILIAFYFFLQFIHNVLKRTSFLNNLQPIFQRIVRYMLLLYEPLAAIILLITFILINPVFDGLIVVFILLVGYTHIRNYTSGWLIHTDQDFAIGQTIRTSNKQGIIAKLGRLGLHLQTNEGIHYINYSRLLSDGYTLLAAGEEIGGFYRLQVKPQENPEKGNQAVRLMDLLATAPYVDWSHKPELTLINEEQNQFEAKLLLKEESHLMELIGLAKEWGYACEIINEN